MNAILAIMTVYGRSSIVPSCYPYPPARKGQRPVRGLAGTDQSSCYPYRPTRKSLRALITLWSHHPVTAGEARAFRPVSVYDQFYGSVIRAA